MRKIFWSICFLLLWVPTWAQADAARPGQPVYEQASSLWADSVLQTMDLEERIAQLFMVAAWSNKGHAHRMEIRQLIKEYGIGGLIFFQGGPHRQVELLREYQSVSEVPLLVGMDLEWGLAMRLDSTLRYPRQMALGAIRNDALIERMGRDIAEQMKLIGTHVSFSPVVDVNNNAANPVINSRSFGESKHNVAAKGAAYMRGLQLGGILANAKHFPGHGDTGTDSHYDLPVIPFSRERLDSLELFPFRYLVHEGVGSVMVAHLNIPQLDSASNLPSTLSEKIVNDLLKEELGFEGLIFTDAMNMKGLAKYFAPGEADVKALQAGNDVLLFPGDVPKAIEMVKQAIDARELKEERVNESCLKVLKAKYWCGVGDSLSLTGRALQEALDQPRFKAHRNHLAEAALTVVKNEENALPVLDMGERIAAIAIGGKKENVFHSTLNWYADVDGFVLERNPNAADVKALRTVLKDYDRIVLSIHGFSSPKNNFGVTDKAVLAAKQLMTDKPTSVVLFANPYSLNKAKELATGNALVLAYEDREEFHLAAANLVFGGIGANGKLPVSISGYPYGSGLELDAIRMAQATPEQVGINSTLLQQVDSIALNGIEEKAYPGCVVLVAKEGRVIYEKAFGHHSYKYRPTVATDDIYDLASITKIVSTTSALMKMVGEGKINLDRNICDYLPELVEGNERYMNMNLREMLAHQAGLLPWIPFYVKTVKDRGSDPALYSKIQDAEHQLRVAENLYMLSSYQDTILKRILDTKLRKERDYKYSDLGYYFLQAIIERVSGLSLDEYMDQNFYGPMGLRTLGYHPRRRHDLDDIVPTEYDVEFRRQQVHGDVHDPGAAMLGGVGGHAGVFSNARDLAAFMQMLLDGGSYGGQRYLAPEVIAEFTKCQFCTGLEDENRRGAGFDKPVMHGGPGPTCECVSYASFGHSGFTGTLTWADPDTDLVYVFLSNRIYPNAQNKKLITMGIRTEIMQVVYDALAAGEVEEEPRKRPELGPAGK